MLDNATDRSVLAQLSDELRLKLMREHEVPVAASDPLLMALTGTHFIATRVLRDAETEQTKLAKRLEEDLERLGARFLDAHERAGSDVVEQLRQAHGRAVTHAVQLAAEKTTLRIEASLAAHGSQLRTATWVVALACSLAVLAACGALYQARQAHRVAAHLTH